MDHWQRIGRSEVFVEAEGLTKSKNSFLHTVSKVDAGSPVFPGTAVGSNQFYANGREDRQQRAPIRAILI